MISAPFSAARYASIRLLILSAFLTFGSDSIHILLNRLLAKGALIEGGFARSGKSYGRLYEATLSGTDYYAQNVFYGGEERLEMLFDAMLQSPDMSKELIRKFVDKLLAKSESL